MYDPNDLTRLLSSVPPCPPWCSWPAGHEHTDEALYGGYVLRYHEDGEDLGGVFSEAAPHAASTCSSVSIGISCEEQAVTDQGPALQAASIITLWTENPVLTADEARQVAALLVPATERLDEVLGVQR